MLSQREKMLIRYTLRMAATKVDGRRTSNVVRGHFDAAERAEIRNMVRKLIGVRRTAA